MEKKEDAEDGIAKKISEITGDQNWISTEGRKTLTLEHHMAAKRLRFAEFFMPLYGVRDFRTGLLDGSLSGIPLFIRAVLPLTNAIKAGNQFEIARIIRSQSPLLKAKTLRSESDPAQNLERVRVAVRDLEKCIQNASANCMDVLRIISAHGLFELPENLRATLRADAVGIANAPDDPSVSLGRRFGRWVTGKSIVLKCHV